MKIKRFCLHGLLIAATWVASSLSFPLPASGQKPLLGNCGKQRCEDILAKLRSRWPEQIREYEAECNENNRLGLLVFSNPGKGRRVSLACWGEKESDGSRDGDLLGILPFPGEEANFASSWNCSDRKCKKTLAKLRKLYPKQIKQYEVSCAIKDGDLILNILKPERGKVEIECGFFAYRLYDTNGDGVADGDRGTTVGIVLGSFPVPK